MKINGYALEYDPTGLEEENTPDINESLVPFNDYIISDLGTIKKSLSFELILTQKEIEDITGMLESSRLCHIEFEDINGFFYVTKFDKSWIKYMDNYKVVSYTLDGYYTDTNYLRLGYFKNLQQTDFQIVDDVTILLPSNYTNKIVPTPDGQYGGLGCNLYKWVNPTKEIKFKASPEIFKDGCYTYSDGTRFYGNKSKFKDDIIIKNNIIELRVRKEDSERLFDVYNSSGVFLGHVMDGINSLEDEDINIKPHPFNPKLKLNHSTFRLELNRNYMELQSPSVVRIDQKRFIVPSKMYNPDTHYGGMFNTTNSPQPLFIDRLVPMVPGQLNYKFSPGFSHFTPGETIRLTTFTTDKSYHPNDGFNPNTMRNYLMFSNVTHIFSDYNEWTKSGTWDPQTNGNSYNGIPNYINSNVAGSYVQVTKNLNYYSGSDGYDFYLLARNLNNSDSSFKFYIDGVDKGTVNFVYANSGNNCCGIYLGDLVPTTPSHTFKIQVVSGNIGLFYILMVPQFDWSFGTPLNDLKQSYNIN